MAVGGAATVCAALLLALAPVAAAQEPPGQSEESTCTRKSGTFKPGKAVQPPITLTADLPASTVNFGGDRGWKFIDVVLKASRPLPPRVTVAQLDLEVLRRLVRQGDTATTVASKPMKFTEPRFNPRRDTIAFTICLDGAGLSAGRYLGAVSVEGPPGIGPVSLTVGAAAKDEELFQWTVGIAGAVVLLLLIWRSATTEQKDKAREVADEVVKETSDDDKTVTDETRKKAEAATAEKARVKGSWKAVFSPGFLLTTPISAALALGAAFTIYSQNTGWGSDPVVDAFAVVSAVLAAAGFRSLLLTTAGK